MQSWGRRGLQGKASRTWAGGRALTVALVPWLGFMLDLKVRGKHSCPPGRGLLRLGLGGRGAGSGWLPVLLIQVLGSLSIGAQAVAEKAQEIVTHLFIHACMHSTNIYRVQNLHREYRYE